jgi:cyclophilin family peptidyl-prolyl cis-trans isomerase/HEAT repeat protein
MVAASAAHAQITLRAPSAAEVRLYARLMAMTDARQFDRTVVGSALVSTWSPLRAAGALAIGQVGPRHGKPGLAILDSLLSDPDLTVASNAAYSLGLLRDSTSIASLARALGGRAPVAREAAWALGEIGAPARGAIVTGLSTSRGDDALAIQLLMAASKLRPVPVAELRPYLAMASRPSVQWAASYAIARPRAPAGVRDLIALAGSPELTTLSSAGGAQTVVAASLQTAEAYVVPDVARQRTRAEIARALARQSAGDSLETGAVPVLLRLARDPHPHVRINAVRSLGSYPVKGREAVVAATSDADANVRIAAAQSLGTVLDSVITAWTPLWQRDTSLMYRSSLLASAARVGVSLPAVAEWRTHADWHYRVAALNAAGALTDKARIAEAAKLLLRDPDGRVRSVAYGLVNGNDTAAPPAAVRSILVDALRDDDLYARATALSVLGSHARAQEVPAVIASYVKSLADSGNDARIAGIAYLAAAWKADSAAFAPALRQQVTALRPSDDPLVRAAAESASIFASWSSVSNRPRPQAWYENLVRTYVVPALRGNTQRATIRTRRGDIVLELFGADAPITVWNFMNLARTGYYRGTGFHRVVPNFVAQDGDPRDDGTGGPGYAIRDEMNRRRYERGALGMALSGPDTGGSQYFITHSPQPHLDGHYTVFGRVLRGFDALDALVQGDRILSITVR